MLTNAGNSTLQLAVSQGSSRLDRKAYELMSIIGGKFGLEVFSHREVSGGIAGLFEKRNIAFVNARSALACVAQRLKTKTLWLPSYFCPSMLSGIKPLDISINFYEVDYDLKIVSKGWIDGLHEADLVIFIDYFGFPAERRMMKTVKDTGAFVLDDASQALLTPLDSRFADFTLYSPRKFLGVPDGGILVFNTESAFETFDLSSPPGDWLVKAVEATVMRRIYDQTTSGDKTWHVLFKQVEEEMPVGLYRMSDVSCQILKTTFNAGLASQKRKENFKYLLENLNKVSLYNSLPPEVVPLGFPVRVKSRKSVLDYLYAKEIYPPVHWDIKEACPEKFAASHRLSCDLFTIPCDQRYDENDMIRIVNEMENSGALEG